MGYYPIVMDLTGRDCLIVGGGEVALRKAESLTGAGGNVTVIALEIDSRLEILPGVRVEKRAWKPGDTAGYTLVFAATDDRAVNQAVSDEAKAKQLAWLFELFPILKERQNQMAQTLSGGEQQMLAIGRALMMQPKILILDEPTLGLAPVILEQLSKALEKLRTTTAITVLLGEQNVTFALPHADRVYVWQGDPGRFAEETGAGYL